ncbi:DNRLRE domain-containing protein [Candidatus Pacearchaeota archaeon]|nr:DNRLRE domain-containing protein [Candidatus Pacearchaeota archaeon]
MRYKFILFCLIFAVIISLSLVSASCVDICDSQGVFANPKYYGTQNICEYKGVKFACNSVGDSYIMYYPTANWDIQCFGSSSNYCWVRNNPSGEWHNGVNAGTCNSCSGIGAPPPPETCAGNPVPAGCSVSGENLECSLSEGMVEDATIHCDSSSSNYGNDDSLKLYYNTDVGCSKTAVLLKLKDSIIPASANKVYLKLYYYFVYAGGVGRSYRVYKANQDWSESSITWNSYTGNGKIYSDSDYIDEGTLPWESTPYWKSFDITSAFNYWKSGGQNNGIIIAPGLGGPVVDGNIFYSSEYSDATKRPKIIFEGACGVSSVSCPAEQVIMKLSETTNSHGALYSDTNYNVDICYKDIFGSEYTGVNPHDCTGTNKVVGLNAAGNAHAEVPSRTSYLTNVCYGDLSCEMKTDPTPCSSGFTNVVRLSAETNAHLENASYTNYPVKICCKPGLASVVSGAYWSNMINVKISLADVKDTVKLNVAGAGLSGNINYTIYKQCSGLGCIPAFFFGDKVIATVNSSYGYATWQAGKKNDGSFETGDYYFKAKVSGIEYNSYDTPVYGVLTVNAPERNSLPNAVIVKPDAESKWLAGTNINFNQASYDEDDDLLVRWNFDDGNITSLYNCMTSNCNTTHKYVSSGAKVIGLAAEEMLRGQKDYDYRRIFVYKEGINVFAVISSPDPTIGEKIYLGIVDFNANLSYVASCTVDVCPVIPAYGKSSGCYEVRNSTALLKCYDLDNSKIGAGTFNLWFNWTFDEGPSLYGSWIENYSKFVGFKRGFVLPREHEARLLVGYEKL